MKTALVVPCLSVPEIRYHRIRDHLAYYGALRPEWTPILLHDGPFPMKGRFNACTVEFPEHLGRHGLLGYPYLWRALFFLRSIFDEFGFDKIVWCEDDFRIFSPEMFEYVDDLNLNVWWSVFSHRFGFPETGLQVIGKRCLAYRDFITGGGWTDAALSQEMQKKPFEFCLPFTHVEKDMFLGDRYNTNSPAVQPPNADWAACIGGEWNQNVVD